MGVGARIESRDSVDMAKDPTRPTAGNTAAKRPFQRSDVMSSTLHAEIINCRQQEVASRAIHVAHAAEASAVARRGHRAIRRRVVGALAALAAAGLCIAVATATPVSAQTSQPLFRVGHAATTSGQARPFAVASGATAVDPARFAAERPRAGAQRLRAVAVHEDRHADAQHAHGSVCHGPVVASGRRASSRADQHRHGSTRAETRVFPGATPRSCVHAWRRH